MKKMTIIESSSYGENYAFDNEDDAFKFFKLLNKAEKVYGRYSEGMYMVLTENKSVPHLKQEAVYTEKEFAEIEIETEIRKGKAAAAEDALQDAVEEALGSPDEAA